MYTPSFNTFNRALFSEPINFPIDDDEGAAHLANTYKKPIIVATIALVAAIAYINGYYPNLDNGH